MRVAQFLAAAVAAYVLFRAGAVFAGAAGAVVAALVLVAAAAAGWRRRAPLAAAGLVTGMLLSGAALAL